MFSDWKKGGLRYRKLKARVPEYLAPANVRAFFVGVRGQGRRFQLINWINPFVVFQREYVIVVMADRLSVLRLRRPAIFSAAIAGIEYEAPLGAADVDWRDGELIVDKVVYRPIAFHGEDAERVAELLLR